MADPPVDQLACTVRVRSATCAQPVVHVRLACGEDGRLPCVYPEIGVHVSDPHAQCSGFGKTTGARLLADRRGTAMSSHGKAIADLLTRALLPGYVISDSPGSLMSGSRGILALARLPH